MIRSFFFCAVWFVATTFAAVESLYLSWSEDPTTTMTIQWLSPPDEKSEIKLLLPDGIVSIAGTNHPFAEEPIVVHTVRLHDLLPNTDYSFQIGDKTYKFRTAPTQTPLKFVIGGDLYLSPRLFRKMCQVVVAQDPLFAVLGGDLAYAIDSPSVFANKPPKQWRKFLADWTESMQTKEGRLIPFLVVPGNHDISRRRSELFFELFDFPEKKLYRAIDFGSYLSLILLDTGHYSPIAGPQTDWLKQTLAKRANFPYRLAIYHVGAYPSFYPEQGTRPKDVRSHWCPLFDQYGVQAAFEHHSHTFKKTVPLKANQKDPTGTIYFGDGCWGVKPRITHPAWYLDKAESKNHVYLVEVTNTHAKVRALGLLGQLDLTQIQSH